MFFPVHVYFAGIDWPSAKAVLVSCIAPFPLLSAADTLITSAAIRKQKTTHLNHRSSRTPLALMLDFTSYSLGFPIDQ